MKRFVLAGAVAASLCSFDAAAQQDLVGTWKVSGATVGLGQSLHPNHSVEGDTPRFFPTDLTVIVEKQEGEVFYGTMNGPRGSRAASTPAEPLRGPSEWTKLL